MEHIETDNTNFKIDLNDIKTTKTDNEKFIPNIREDISVCTSSLINISLSFWTTLTPAQASRIAIGNGSSSSARPLTEKSTHLRYPSSADQSLSPVKVTI
ncbi:unnamed protein product [Thlaspi arvense]|uniref:Uncharacterized protein n=1 Tax=Thlaspi arvense TaxID=13288 RepID=A0AAU9RRQ2_THLAR|nr:unnamed protein product [Thlaspi arvense]